MSNNRVSTRRISFGYFIGVDTEIKLYIYSYRTYAESFVKLCLLVVYRIGKSNYDTKKRGPILV